MKIIFTIKFRICNTSSKYIICICNLKETQGGDLKYFPRRGDLKARRKALKALKANKYMTSIKKPTKKRRPGPQKTPNQGGESTDGRSKAQKPAKKKKKNVRIRNGYNIYNNIGSNSRSISRIIIFICK
jgi:hypothetical protein